MGRQETLNFLITPDLPREEQVLIGIRALEKLKLLPVNWPANLDFDFLKEPIKKDKVLKLSVEQVNKICENRKMENNISEKVWHNLSSSEDIPRLKDLPEALQKCIKKNKSIFSTKLNKSLVFKCKLLKLYLKKVAILPRPCTRARAVLAHWDKKSKEIIFGFMDKGLNKRVTGPTTMCFPSFYVFKPKNGMDPRIVIHFKPVNNQIERPHHPSSRPEHCWSRVPVGGKYFVSVDMSSAYLQMPVDDLYLPGGEIPTDLFSNEFERFNGSLRCELGHLLEGFPRIDQGHTGSE
jgi:hypothetical protein